MDIVKRIEIIVPSIEVNAVLKRFAKVGVVKYNLINHVVGRSETGEVVEDWDDQSGNTYILTTCKAGEEDKLFWELQPILQKFGGLCLVSDAVCYRC
jgi:hypothetical protein